MYYFFLDLAVFLYLKNTNSFLQQIGFQILKDDRCLVHMPLGSWAGHADSPWIRKGRSSCCLAQAAERHPVHALGVQFALQRMPGFAPVQLAFFQAQSGIARNRSGDPKFSPQASSISGLRNSAEGPLRAEEFGLMSVLVLKTERARTCLSQAREAYNANWWF